MKGHSRKSSGGSSHASKPGSSSALNERPLSKERRWFHRFRVEECCTVPSMKGCSRKSGGFRVIGVSHPRAPSMKGRSRKSGGPHQSCPANQETASLNERPLPKERRSHLRFLRAQLINPSMKGRSRKNGGPAAYPWTGSKTLPTLNERPLPKERRSWSSHPEQDSRPVPSMKGRSRKNGGLGPRIPNRIRDPCPQ